MESVLEEQEEQLNINNANGFRSKASNIQLKISCQTKEVLKVLSNLENVIPEEYFGMKNVERFIFYKNQELEVRKKVAKYEQYLGILARLRVDYERVEVLKIGNMKNHYDYLIADTMEEIAKVENNSL